MINSRLFKRIFGQVAKFLPAKGNITFITGANAHFYESLRDNLLTSIIKYEPHCSIIIWDLGLEEKQLEKLYHIVSEYNFVGGGEISVRKYPENDLPKHYSMKCWNYAFKSYCIFHSLTEDVHTRFAFWLDAGCGISGMLKAERLLLTYNHFYSPYSSTTIGKYTANVTLKAFANDQLGYSLKPMLSGGVQGFDMQYLPTIAQMTEWYHACMAPDLIAPLEASLQNHRYDQSLLSLVYYSRHKKLPYLCRYYYNIKIHLNKH